MVYLVLKSIHIIFIVAWFAGLFYIFRLFVYHIENWEKAEVRELFQIMEKRLIHYIMTPAFVVAFVMGLGMFHLNPGLIKAPWMHTKLMLVFFLLGYHYYSYLTYKKLRSGVKALTSKQCRMINEFPTVILILVVFLAILKPWS